MTTELKLQRHTQVLDTNGTGCTGGTLTCDHLTFATLEDLPQDTKIAGITRIPAGRYRVKYREVLSPLTQTYRNKYDWFSWHLELQDVPDYNNVYIHIGNYSKDTDGCILVGTKFVPEMKMVSQSVLAFEELYDYLKDKSDIWITITDED